MVVWQPKEGNGSSHEESCMNGTNGNKTRILLHEVEARCFNLDGIEQMEAVTRDHSRNSVMDYKNSFHTSCANQPLSFEAPFQDTHVSSRAHRVRNTPSLPSNSPDALQTPTRDGENRYRVSTRLSDHLGTRWKRIQA